MPSKQKRLDPPSSLTDWKEEQSAIQKSHVGGDSAKPTPKDIAAAMGGELPAFKDQAQSRVGNNASAGYTEIAMVEGIAIADEAEEAKPAPSPVAAGSSALTGSLPPPPPSLSLPTDLRKHVIWAIVIVCITVAVAVVVVVVVLSSNSSGNSSSSSTNINESPTTTNAPNPRAPVNPPSTPRPANSRTPQAPVNPPSTPRPANAPTPQVNVNPSSTPAPGQINSTEVGGWVLTALGESCDSACDSAGGSCNAAGSNRVNSEEEMRYVAVTLLGLPCSSFGSTGTFSPYLQISDNSCVYQCCDNHQCSASFFGYYKICCCSFNLSDCPVSAV